MSRYDLSEVLLEKGQARIRLRRGALPVVSAAPVLPTMMPTPVAAAASSPPPAASTPAPAAPSKALHEIKSPMVGTFYNREKPETEPYVKKGSKVTPSTVVGLIEAMKLF